MNLRKVASRFAWWHHRKVASRLLWGHGLEIGALHNPFKLPKTCTVDYMDIADKPTLSSIFPELNPADIVEVKYIGDICESSVKKITNKQFSFVIANHILEHVANPMKTLENMWDGVENDGYLVLSIPDKDYSFDRSRPLTSFDHILADYENDVMEADNDHYLDFLEHVHPEVFSSEESLANALHNVKSRMEHVHVWNSETFRSHLGKIINMLEWKTEIIFEVTGQKTKREYFVVIHKK